MFIDLKTTFDSVDRKVLLGLMRAKRIRKSLVKRWESVKRNDKKGKSGWRRRKEILDGKGSKAGISLH